MISRATVEHVIAALEGWRQDRNKEYGARVSRQDLQALLDKLYGVSMKGNRSFRGSMLAIARAYRFNKEGV